MIISEANSCVNDNTSQENNQPQNLCYIYRHIRLDTNMPFYIGKGTNTDGKYARSRIKATRSNYWKHIVDKHGYRIEIMLKNLSEETANRKEKEFIELYGRIDLGTGILVNMTDGGEGLCGVSKETRRRIGIKNKNRIISDKQKKKIKETLMLNPMSLERRKAISDFHKGNKYNLGKKHTEKTKEILRLANKCKPVGQYDKDGILIKEYPSIHSVKNYGFNRGHVGRCCNGKELRHKGFQWKFI